VRGMQGRGGSRTARTMCRFPRIRGDIGGLNHVTAGGRAEVGRVPMLTLPCLPCRGEACLARLTPAFIAVFARSAVRHDAAIPSGIRETAQTLDGVQPVAPLQEAGDRFSRMAQGCLRINPVLLIISIGVVI